MITALLWIQGGLAVIAIVMLILVMSGPIKADEDPDDAPGAAR